jgi:hypothetical protein
MRLVALALTIEVQLQSALAEPVLRQMPPVELRPAQVFGNRLVEDFEGPLGN